MARLLLVIATALALLPAAAAATTATPAAATARRAREFVAAANEICSDGEKKIQEITSQGQQELQQASSDKKRRDAVGDLLEQTAEEYRPYLDRLDDSSRPRTSPTTGRTSSTASRRRST